MATGALNAARTVCELRNWSVSNLELQKILYIAHMFHLGRTGQPLLVQDFEAWDYGPVVPELYHRVKGFGNAPVGNVFHWISPVALGPDRDILNECADATRNTTASRLVAITHWDNGAWAKCYRPGVRGIIIPNALIAEEYQAREAG